MKHLIGVSCTQPIVAIHETRNVTHTFTSLMHSTSYCVRVRAYSESGFGPWSEYFVGATLREGLWGCCAVCACLIFVDLLLCGVSFLVHASLVIDTF